MTKKQKNLTIAQMLTTAQQLTDTHFFPELEFQPVEEDERAALKQVLQDHRTEVDKLSVPFSIYRENLAAATAQPVNWLWEKRIPLRGITLLDGDHGCGKSLLALQLAAHVSSGSRLPDGSTTMPGGVVIVSPYTDATTTQLQILTALGANLSRVEVLSFTPVRAPEFHTGGYCPFSLPEDLPRLFSAIERLDARLVIFDPFISLLSRDSRWTNERLGHFLTDLNQRLIERNVACLLIRNCTAKGGHARPSVLERSDHFANTAASHLLLTPDPMQPDHLLLTHAASHHGRLTPTLSLQIQPMPTNPDIPHITVQGSHSLKAKDFIESRPDTLHRRLLFHHLQAIIADTTDPIPVATLYARSPHSSPFQIQRSLNDLLHMGQIERPARGLYAPNPTLPLNKTATTTSNTSPSISLNGSAATTPDPLPVPSLNGSAATTPDSPPVHSLNSTAAITPDPLPIPSLNGSAATTPDSPPVHSLNSTAATTPDPLPIPSLNGSAATTSDPLPVPSLNGSAAITSDPLPIPSLNGSAAITSDPLPIPSLNGSAATTPDPQPVPSLNGCAAITPDSQPVHSLNGTATITSDSPPVHSLNGTAAITSDPPSVHSLNSSAAITSDPPPVHSLNGTAATTPDPLPIPSLNGTAATTPSPSPASTLKPCGNWRHAPGCKCNT